MKGSTIYQTPREPMSDKVETAVAQSLERCGYAGKDFLLTIAVSGGPDSMALINALYNLRSSLSIQLHLAHLNHNFRKEADADAKFAEHIAKSLGIPFTIHKTNPMAYQKEHKISSFEEAARQVRYRFLAQVTQTNLASAVLVGHTYDDQAETVLMHILRGTGVTGLVGMKELSIQNRPEYNVPLTILRPLLQITKEEAREYCQARDIPFRDDPANLSLRFTRNKIRNVLLPSLREYNPKITNALVRLSQTASFEQDFLASELDAIWQTVTTIKENCISINRQDLADLHPFIQSLILRKAYQEFVGDTRGLHQSHVEFMKDYLWKPPGKSLDLPKGLRLLSTYSELLLGYDPQYPCPYPLLIDHYPLKFLSSKPGTLNEPNVTTVAGWRISARFISSIPQNIEYDPFTAWFDPSIVSNGTAIRARIAGDRFQPAGMDKEKKLQDFMVNAKIPRSWRSQVPLLTCESGIAWVIGYRIAEWARFKSRATECLEVNFRRAVS